MQHDVETRICPVLRYRQAPTAIDWLVRAFGFSVHERHNAPNGDVMHAELRYGAGAIGLSTAGAVDPANPWTTVRHGLYVVTHAVDQVVKTAAAGGALIVQPPNDTSYGAREASMRDPGGHLWSVGTYPMGIAGAEPTLFVGLHYADGPQALSFLERALGFHRGLTVATRPGVIDHAELSLGHHWVMVSSLPTSSGHWHGQAQCTHVWVDDVDDHHARAASVGATIIEPPHDTPYRARTYYAADGEGFVWSFGTYRPTRA